MTEQLNEYDCDYEIGQDNIEVGGLDVHNPVFFVAAGLVLLFITLTLLFRRKAAQVLGDLRTATLENFDWLFAVTPLIALLFCLFFAITRVGKVRLGGENATPEFSRGSWVAMLFAAGVGIGFMFWGAAEPLAYHTSWFGTPLDAEVGTERADRLAFSATLFHWGLSPWAVYAVVGLSLGFFAHSKGLPLTIRSAFYPLLGDRIWGWWGHAIDLFAVVSTIFGLATTIGLGGTQAASGLAYIFGFKPTIWMQVALIGSMTALAVVSVIRGMDGGVKLLSNINMCVAFVLMVFVFIAGPTLLILSGLWENTIAYIADTPALTNWFGREDTAWYHSWTIFYWAWWISWSPFVGMFIARISYGRTVREYLTVVLLAPFVICILWFTVFGETAIWQFEMGVGDLANGVSAAETVLFQMLGELPWETLTSLTAIALLIVFIVTSADSGALVVDTITSGGKTDAPKIQRVFWACTLGLTASVLLYGGGTQALTTLQAGTIIAALPFTVILLVCCVSLLIALREESEHLATTREAASEDLRQDQSGGVP